jgi:acetyl-CoA carboxylase carboxyltransferase component
MSWQEEVTELARRKALAAGMGGPAGIERQHAQGKLTARERIDAFVDAGSFREFAGLVGNATYDQGTLATFTPKASVDGFCRIGGRRVVVSAGDFTVRGGSGGGAHGGLGNEPSSNRRALEWRVPYVRLLDAAGGSVRSFEEIGRTYLPDGNTMSATDVKLLRAVPVVSTVLGSVAGLPAVNGAMCHFGVMVKNISQLFPGGPPVVKAGLGIDISKEELGGHQVHTQVSGVVDNLAETEVEAFEMVRRFLSYLPQNVWEMAPRGSSDDDPNRCEESLLSLVPKVRRRPYNVRALIESVVDQGTFFEMGALHGRARMTGFARVHGYPVGVMANNPMYLGGSTDVAAGGKVIKFLQLCDTFHLPVVSFADEPGFMVGPDSERQGIERAGARLVSVVCDTQMPWLTIVVGQLYGVAGQCQHRPTGMFRRYAWPSANWGSMHIEGGAFAAYRREIEAAPDPELKRQEVEAMLKALASPFRTAEATGQDIIDPRETRSVVSEFVEDAQVVLRSQLGPTAVPFRP